MLIPMCNAGEYPTGFPHRIADDSDAIAAFGKPGGEVSLPSPATPEAIYMAIQHRLKAAAAVVEQ